MILRLSICLTDSRFQNSLCRRLAAGSDLVTKIRPSKSIWRRLIGEASDVIIIHESLVSGPLEQYITILNEMPEMPTTIVITDSAEPSDSAELISWGFDTVLYSGLEQQQLFEAIEATIDSRRQFLLHAFAENSGERTPQLSDFISRSQEMQMFMHTVGRVAGSKSTILLLGETGVGKEHLARAIHAESPDSDGPFLAINCAALPEQLLESELFGHEKGAYTGAATSRRGAFELAHGGVLFLDEIGELPLHLQAKLLRVLQDFNVKRIGSENSVRVDVRLIAASNRDLEEEVREKRFRSDLYFRLSVIELEVPPLRQRREDIPDLARRFTAAIGVKIKRDIRHISDEALKYLIKYDWPGNVRELANVIERAMLLCEGDIITRTDLPDAISHLNRERLLEPAALAGQDWEQKTLAQVKEDVWGRVEKAYISGMLTTTKGKVSLAAERAGIHTRGLYGKMQKYGLRKEDFK
ncbi:MAG: sigma-54 interaction domain-containing protein [Phycisphaerae bacterium]|jgi:DNA-binding NtrC family response regulator